jgi:hypothetical protein
MAVLIGRQHWRLGVMPAALVLPLLVAGILGVGPTAWLPSRLAARSALW